MVVALLILSSTNTAKNIPELGTDFLTSMLALTVSHRSYITLRGRGIPQVHFSSLPHKRENGTTYEIPGVGAPPNSFSSGGDISKQLLLCTLIYTQIHTVNGVEFRNLPTEQDTWAAPHHSMRSSLAPTGETCTPQSID